MLELSRSRRDALATAMRTALVCPIEPRTSADAIKIGHVQMMMIATGPARCDPADIWHLAVAIDFEARRITRRTGLKYSQLDVVALAEQLHDPQLAEASSMLAGIYPRDQGGRTVWIDAPLSFYGPSATLDLQSILRGWDEM